MKEPFAETLSQVDADLIEEAAAESLPVRRSGRRALRIAAIAAALLLGAAAALAILGLEHHGHDGHAVPHEEIHALR